MTCSECIDLLQRRLDGDETAAGDPVVAAHLQTCVECRTRYALARRIEKALERQQRSLPPLDFAPRMTANLLADRRRRQRRRWLGDVGRAVAAGLLVSLGLRLAFVSPVIPDKSPTVAADTSANSIKLQDSVAQARSAMANMTSRAADETVGPTRQLLASIVRPEWRDLPPMDQPARSLQEVGQGVSSGFEPMATSAHRAFDMLVHNLTPGDADAR